MDVQTELLLKVTVTAKSSLSHKKRKPSKFREFVPSLLKILENVQVNCTTISTLGKYLNATKKKKKKKEQSSDTGKNCQSNKNYIKSMCIFSGHDKKHL